MSETRKTITFGVVALILLLAAFLTTPGSVAPDDFSDVGEAFFPDFADPNIATTLEVIEYDEETASARPFKVTFKDGRWTIPSHHDYPADGKDRLARTAAGLIGLKKDDYRTSNVADYEACAVVDPLDEATALKGRGKRVTIKDANDQVLADLIFGQKLAERADLRFVRVPGQKRVYVAKTDMDISTKFGDWIEPDLLQVAQADVTQVILKDYSINERTRTVDRRGTLTLTKKDDEWSANRMSSSEEIDMTKMNELLREIDDLKIVGVRTKPAGLSDGLRRTEGDVPITQENLLSLQGKGYYFTRDGSLLSNEGELEVRTSKGVTYILRFGEVLYGTGDDVTAGGESEGSEESGPGENRYLFITATFDQDSLPEPPKPSNTRFEEKSEDEWTDADRQNKERKEKHDAWQVSVDEGKSLAEELNSRFADWYYVISADAFDKIHADRADLVKKTEN
jgi:hypothetical protein